MSSCDPILLSLYHDGELDAARSSALEKHLANCPPCVRQLQDLRRLSGRLSVIELPEIIPAEQARILRFVRGSVIQVFDRLVMRIGLRLAAVAAVVLVVTSIWLADTMKMDRSEAKAVAPDWQQTAVTLRADSRLPEWMVRGLGGETP
jgi:anti-sigma factor RsiW